MALRLLAGPYPMKDINGNYCRFFKRPMWFDRLMALVGVVYIKAATGDDIESGCLVQLDGVVCRRNSSLSAYDSYAHDVEGTGIARTNTYNFGLATRGVNVVTLHPEGAAIANPLQLLFGGMFCLQDRVLYTSGSDIRGRVYGASGDGPIEATIPGGLGGARALSPGPSPGQVFVAGTSAAVLYDYVAKTLIGWRRELGFTATFPPMFSPDLGVWFVVNEATTPQTHHTISIYSDEPVPATLSAPAALAAVTEGSAVEYQTRLLGALNEPCAGVLVDWTSSAPGVIQVVQSTTDQNGYARTRVAVPLNTEGLNFNLTATVVL